MLRAHVLTGGHAAVVAALRHEAESGRTDDLDDDRTPVQRIVAASLPAGRMRLDTGLLDQGLDSLGAVRLAAELNATLGTTILAADVMARLKARREGGQGTLRRAW